MVIDGTKKVKKTLLERLTQAEKRQIKKKGEDTWFEEYYLKDLEALEPQKNKFGITEMKEKEAEGLPLDLKNYLPYACKNCGYDKKIPRRVFKIEIIPVKYQEKKELKKYMKGKYNIYFFKIRTIPGVKILVAGTCPRCESQYLMFDAGLFLKRPDSK